MAFPPSGLFLRRGAPGLLAAAALLAAPAAAQMAFAPFGARAIAMGGAALALPEGAAAVVENPASAGSGSLAAALSGGGVGRESGDFLSPLKIVSGNDPLALAAGAGNLGDVSRAFLTLADPGNGVVGDGRAGIVLTSRGWGLALGATAWAGSFVRADLVHLSPGLDPATSVLYNGSAAVYRALTVQDLALTNSQSFVGGAVRVGATVHVLRGITSSKEESAFTTDVGDPMQMARRAITGAEQTTTKLSCDAGALVTLGVLRVGAVARALNAPEFPFAADAPPADRGSSVTFGPQVRVGASAHVPVLGITFAADVDLTKNDTLIPGLREQDLGGGVEWAIGPLAVRGGATVNLEASSRRPRFTGGVGFGIGPVKADAALVYHPDRSALGAALTARVGL